MRVRGVLALALVLLALPAFAQFDRGQIGGFVRDDQGGVAGASVKITNEQTRLEHTYTSDNGGYYIAPALLPGAYEVAVELSGFKLNGRNPINLALLKPGVRAGAFNTFQPDSLTDGGFSINGSRGDENLVTIDGAIATRTRSAGSMIGTVNVDTVQEMQVLTASYLPEYGRSS
jgi:hypothetical protein